ncbi:MAG: TIR domain-containing protein, partial [Cyanobacteria bacterium P01_F01_bin.4]
APLSIIIHPVDWKASQLSALGVLPTDGKAVTQWRDRDAAWLDVETGIKRAVEAIKGKGYR